MEVTISMDYETTKNHYKENRESTIMGLQIHDF